MTGLVEAPLPRPFAERDLDTLPEPVARHLRAAIAPGAVVARSARLRMRGQIKVGRWLPFRARQVLSPHRGFWWAARAGGLIAGWDRYVAGLGAMRWRLLGLLTVAEADGPDVSRSAAGPVAGEAIWLPTALLPRCGVEWSADGRDRVSRRYELDGVPTTVTYDLDPAGRITTLAFDRWGDPDGTGAWDWYRFGGHIHTHATFAGMTVPGSGSVGWHVGTDRWAAGEFFRFRLTDLLPLGHRLNPDLPTQGEIR